MRQQVLARARAALPHAVAALFVFQVAASCIAVIPNPGVALDRAAWADARAQRELSMWSERLGLPQASLEETLYGATRAVTTTLHTLQAPFRPVQKLTGLSQSWSMFVAGTPHADTFEVRGRSGEGPWRALYARGNPDASLLHAELESARIRAAIFEASWHNYKKSRARLCGVVARRAFATDATLDSVECSYVRTMNAVPKARGHTAPPVRSRETLITRDTTADAAGAR